MKIIISLLANILIIGLFLYSKLLPHKDKLNNNYKNVFKLFNEVLDPILRFFRKFINPFQVGQGLAIDMTQILLLLILLFIINYI
jgi:uncharacterized protein YggT (Ycf19 family)